MFAFSWPPSLRICGPNNHGTGFMEALVQCESGVSVVLEIEIRNGEATLKDIDVKIRG